MTECGQSDCFNKEGPFAYFEGGNGEVSGVAVVCIHCLRKKVQEIQPEGVTDMATKEEEERSMTVGQLLAMLTLHPKDAVVTIEPMGGLPMLEIAAVTHVPRVRPNKDEAVLSIRIVPERAPGGMNWTKIATALKSMRRNGADDPELEAMEAIAEEKAKEPPPEPSGYSFKLRNKIDGVDPETGAYDFQGPGMPQYANAVVVWRVYDAEHLCRLLAMARAAGQAEARADMRKSLGIHVGPWGIRIEGKERT